MPRDTTTDGTIHETFNDTATPAPEMETTQQTSPEPANDLGGPATKTTDFQTTTHLQVQIQEERADVLDAHDERWNRERDHLTAKPFQAPSLGLGSDNGRSVQKEYQERWARWQDHRDGINQLFDRQVADVRAMGTTMTDRFQEVTGQDATNMPEPIAAPDIIGGADSADYEQNSSHRRTELRVEFHRQVRKTTRSL